MLHAGPGPEAFLDAQVHDGKLYVNGKARTEPYLYQAPAYTLSKLRIPADNVRLFQLSLLNEWVRPVQCFQRIYSMQFM